MKFSGIMPALITPLNEDETLNTACLEQLMEYQLEKGADGFYVAGATGEGIALSREVREQLAAEAVRIVSHRKHVIVHIASVNFHDAVALAKHAEHCGADGISAIPPLFFSYSPDEVYAYYKRLAETVSIPLMIYYNPAAGFPMSADWVAKCFEVDNITAIKWTSATFDQVVRLKDLTKGEMNIINGPDEMLLMGLSAGADGGIGSTYNYMLEHYKAIYDSFHVGDYQTAIQHQTYVNRVIEVLKKYSVIPASKVVLEEMGFPAGNAVFPMRRLSSNQRASLIADLKSVGFSF